MCDVMKIEYYDRVWFYLNNNSSAVLVGDIYTDENNYCEGIVSDDSGQEYFMFGRFKKFDNFDLYVIVGDDKVYRYVGKKSAFKYEGQCLLLNDNVVGEFYTKLSILDADSRDCLGDTPLNRFKEKLRIFKDSWLSDDANNSFYNKIFPAIGVEKKINK